MMKRSSQAGFTLAEVLIVSAILFGFLLMVGIVGLRCATSGTNPCETPWGYRDRRCTGYYAPHYNTNPYDGH